MVKLTELPDDLIYLIAEKINKADVLKKFCALSQKIYEISKKANLGIIIYTNYDNYITNFKLYKHFKIILDASSTYPYILNINNLYGITIEAPNIPNLTNNCNSIESLILDYIYLDPELNEDEIIALSANPGYSKLYNKLPNIRKLEMIWYRQYNMDFIFNFPKLTKIYLHNCQLVTDLSQISKCTNLTSLKLRVCVNINNINHITSMKQLRKIYISCCESITDISPILHLTKVEKLSLYNCKNINNNLFEFLLHPRIKKFIIVGGKNIIKAPIHSWYDYAENINSILSDTIVNFKESIHRNFYIPSIISTVSNIISIISNISSIIVKPINYIKNSYTIYNQKNTIAFDNYSNLTYLIIDHVYIRNLSFLLYCKKLEYLKLNNIQTINSYYYISSLTNLRNLHIYNSNLVDLSFIYNCSNLESLSIINTDLITTTNTDLITTNTIYNLQNLNYLKLTYNEKLKDITMLQYCTELKELYLFHYSCIIDFSPIQYCTKLEILDLSKCEDIVDLSFLHKCNKLSHLYLVNCFQLVDISPIYYCRDLKYLNLKATKVKDISVLQNCTNLQDLCLSYTKVTDISPLQHCTKLVKLKIYGLYVQTDLSFISSNCVILNY